MRQGQRNLVDGKEISKAETHLARQRSQHQSLRGSVMLDRQDVDTGRKAPGKQPVGLKWVKGNGPHSRAGQTGVDPIPGVALVRRPVDSAPGILADHYFVRIGRVESYAAIIARNQSAATQYPASPAIG